MTIVLVFPAINNLDNLEQYFGHFRSKMSEVLYSGDGERSFWLKGERFFCAIGSAGERSPHILRHDGNARAL